ncbi:MAG: hypothetical protein LUD01_00305 [Clostridiales bacterium]|nr:hypothetical protein [Clostridiales bacterium]
MNEFLKPYLMSFLQYDESHVISHADYNDKNKSASCHYPIVVFDTLALAGRADQSDIDLEKEIRIDLNVWIHILVTDLDQLIQMEELFRSTYHTPQRVSVFCEDCAVRDAMLFLDEQKEISHKKYPNAEVYGLTVNLKMEDVVQQKMVINPVKIELDMGLQKAVMQHLSLLNEIWIQIDRQRQSVSGDKEKSGFYSRQLEALETQVNEMYNFANIAKTELSLRDSGFLTCYTLMRRKKISFSKATEIMQKDVDRQNSRVRYAQEHYTQKGDEVLNRITDVIVEDVRKKMDMEYPVFLYGGSTYMRFYYDDKTGAIQYPFILVNDIVTFSLDYISYPTQTPDGKKVFHRYSVTALPIVYSVKLSVYAAERNQLEEIVEKVQSAYKEETILSFPDPVYENEFCVFQISDAGKKAAHKSIRVNNTIVYCADIQFRQFPTVYYFDHLSVDHLGYDLWRQRRYLQMAHFCLAAKDKFKLIYKDLNKIEKLLTPSNSLSGGVGSAISNLFQSEDYRQLQQCVNNHQPLNRAQFEREFQAAAQYCSNLFRNITNGIAAADIKNQVVQYENELDNRYEEICNALHIPVAIYGTDGRDSAALSFYINALSENTLYTIDSCFVKYKDKLRRDEEERRRWEEEKRRRRAEEQAYYDEQADADSSYSGGSFLGGIVKTAAGTALGTSGLKKEVRRQTETMRRQSEADRKERQRAEISRRHEESRESQRQWRAAQKENEKRRKKGQEEIPMPKRTWH